MEMNRHLHSVKIDKEKLKIVIQIKDDYNAGKIALADAKRILKEKVRTLKPYEIALAEQELQEFDENECQKEDIQKMLELFEDIMDTGRPQLADNHPIMCYYRENDALKKILLEIEDLVQYPLIKNQWLELYDRLEQFKIHLSRKQNQLYSMLEKKGFDRPTTTMWTLDNFIRDEIRDARKLLDDNADDQFIAVQPTIVADIRDLMQKEETVLYPTSLAMITEAEFEEMKSGDREIGFAWITNDDANAPSSNAPSSNAPSPHPEHHAAAAPHGDTAGNTSLAEDLNAVLRKHGFNTGGANEVFDVATGKLTLEQINLIYRHLPVDLSYVDENEIVCFYSDTDHRVFPRSKNVIGRDVKNCHPRASVHIVEEIIQKFRSGEQDSAEFWINKPEIFIYIRYVAVRDKQGKFRGILEMMQDCTHIRSLKDSQTLLTWKKAGEPDSSTVIQEDSAAADGAQQDNTPEKEGNPHHKKLTAADITPATFLKDIFADYPALKDKMDEISPKFKMLKTPLGRVMLPKATIAIAGERSGIDVDTLLTEIKKRIGK